MTQIDKQLKKGNNIALLVGLGLTAVLLLLYFLT